MKTPTLNTYLVTSYTNYGTACAVINAYSPEEAKKIALDLDHAWDNAEVTLIDTTKPGEVAWAESTGG